MTAGPHDAQAEARHIHAALQRAGTLRDRSAHDVHRHALGPRGIPPLLRVEAPHQAGLRSLFSPTRIPAELTQDLVRCPIPSVSASTIADPLSFYPFPSSPRP